jgi:deoxycytidylate deaminase
MSNDGPIIVGLTGQFGSGCSTVAEYLQKELGFQSYSLSAFIRESAQRRLTPMEFQKLSKPDERRELQDEGNTLREHDSTFLARRVHEQIKAKGNERKDTVIDSIRNPAEVKYLSGVFLNFFLLALDASSDARWLRKRLDYRDDRRLFDKDDQRDKGEDEPDFGQQTEACVYFADVVIDNETQIGYRQDWDKFFFKIRAYTDLMRNPGYRTPTYRELYMHQAYAVSLKSSCTKRQVGAIIVSLGGQEQAAPQLADEAESYVIASGRNDVPVGERICAELGGRTNANFCPKDHQESELLRIMRYCPDCGSELPPLPPTDVIGFKCPKCKASLPRKFQAGKLLDVCRAVHAEEAAILQAAKLGSSALRGTTLYTTTFPCLLCCKSIINAGIKKVIYREPYPMAESVAMLKNCGVSLEKYEGVNAWAFGKMFRVNS